MGSAGRLILFALLYILYICLGAGVFMALEKPYEQELASDIIRRRDGFLDAHTECMTVEELDQFVNDIEEAFQFGVTYAVAVNSTANTMWDFGGSFFFTTTLLTTIGYGHVSPLTVKGQLFCLFFALFGIPFTFFFLGTITYAVSKPSQILLDFLTEKFDHKGSGAGVRVCHLFILFVLILALFFLIPAAIFTTLEKRWNYFESFYFIFVSLTTVGLGDFVPATAFREGSVYESTRSIYFISVSLYLLLGLGMMLLLVDTVIKIPQIQRLWEMTTPASSAAPSVTSSRSSSPAALHRELLAKNPFGSKRKSEEERELTKDAAPIGRSYDTIQDKKEDS
ncbi:potassium channel subfamily K member 1-like [Lytechinus pictus]|uniref:potassium channel subfamily K member 1-like n=1 Tax=Lytechinus pictus TaxID=7653 RepID=UPI0030B9C2EB